MATALRAGALAMAALLLAACAPTGPLQRPGAAAVLDDGRAARLAALPRWSLVGRIAVSDGREGGSGRLEWLQDGAFYDISVRAPVAGGSWRLSGDGRLAQLDGAAPQPLRDADAEALLARELGWHLPVSRVPAWVRGLAHDGGAARWTAGADGLPQRLSEDGWTVEYRAWVEVDGIPMPRRLVARRAPFEVRIAVERWSLHAAE
ncbi:MAG: lipoprotein insertase outer membrane protein LolB [Xanthomonadaceae bacterium]|jgi:outer membrane lipoprotein LolB|nr:lipoprotein insertase outer membrane protein LolB [Xanthomonadaceae bacterium]